MRNSWQKAGVLSLALASIILSCAGSALSTTFIVPSDDELIVEARAIVRGKVLSVTCQLDPEQDRVFTYVTLRVKQVLKGQIAAREITIKEPGGEVGNKGSLVFGTPRFKPGEKVLLYLDTWPDGSLRVHQMLLGKFSIIRDAGTGVLLVTRAFRDAGVSVVGQSTSGPVTNQMELSSYIEMVRSRLAVNAVRASEFESRYYGSAAMLARPPEYSAEAEGNIEAQFHLWSPPLRWFEADSAEPVVFVTNLEGAPNPQVASDIVAAMNAWSTVPGCSIRVVDGGPTTGCGVFIVDGENTISFNNCDGYFAPGSPCSGILAVASIASYTRSQTVVVNGVTFSKALESNLSFNPSAACYLSNHCNMQETATHEMGHGLGLHHSWDPTFGGSPSASDQSATMYYMAHFDGRCASPATDDVNGITFIYPSSGGPPLTVVTSSLNAGAVGASYLQTLIAGGGAPPYSWSVVPATGTLPPGLNLSSAGAISGTPSTSGAFGFNVQVSDSLSRTAQKALSITVAPPALEITTSSVPLAQVGTAFDYQLAATGGKPPYTWAVSSGSLATGLTLAATTGIISGTPSAIGTFDFAVDVTDAELRTARKALSIDVKPPPLSIGPAASLDAVQGTAFNYQPIAAGGAPPYTWSVSSGAVPAGLTLSSSTGAISGTPTASGTFGLQLTVSDQAGSTATAGISIRVIDPETIPAIKKVKYKGRKKLIVNGNRVNPAAKLIVDGTATQAVANGGQFKLRNLTLTPGQHEIRIVNPENISSQPFVLTVE